MEFSQFDTRKNAEAGVFLALNHPYDGTPIGSGTKAPGFMIRGTASRSVQARLAEMQKVAKEAAEAEGDAEAVQKAMMEKMHEDMIESAMRFIISGVNMEIEGQPVGEDPEMIRRILDMTFPDLKVETDEKGNQVTQEVQTDDGKSVKVPKFTLGNEPFALQVSKAAEDGQRFLGKPAKG